MKMKRIKLISLLLAMSLMVTGCAQGGGRTDYSGGALNGISAGEGGVAGAEADAPAELPEGTVPPSGGFGDATVAMEGTAAAADAGMAPSYKEDIEVYGDEAFYEALEMEGGFAAEAAGGAYGEYCIPQWENSVPVSAGTLTAGEWEDNLHWSFWQDLFQTHPEWEEYRGAWNQSYLLRIRADVSAEGKPVENAKVTLSDGSGNFLWQGVTNNSGICYLFYPSSAVPSKLTAVSGSETAETAYIEGQQSYSLQIKEDTESKTSLDLMIVCDTTGSMSDELGYLQAELEDVINQVKNEYGNLPIRLSVNFYRDHGDDYVIRDFPFTDNIDEALKQLSQQSADGGGDEPEYVNGALENAINGHQWNEDSVKLMFIILDAPPHRDSDIAEYGQDYENNGTAGIIETNSSQMNKLASTAAANGIRVIPILSSGGNKEAEYLMRDFAIKTGGTYLFLTDDSGVSVGGHIEPTVGSYTVEKLNALMVKIIGRYLEKVQTVPEYSDIPVELPEPVGQQQTEITAPPYDPTDPTDTTGVTAPPETRAPIETDIIGTVTFTSDPNPIPVPEPITEPFVPMGGSTEFIKNDGSTYDVDGEITLSGEYKDGEFNGTMYNGLASSVSFSMWVNLYDSEGNQIQVLPDAAVIDIAQMVYPGKEAGVSRDLAAMFGKLTPGTYTMSIIVFDEYGGSREVSTQIEIK